MSEQATAPASVPDDLATVSVQEAAAILQVSERHLREQIRTGAFPHRRLGRRVIIPVASLRAWMAGGAA